MVMKGLSAIKEMMNSGAENLKIQPNASAQVRIITPGDEILSLYEHVEQFGGQWRTVPCLGKNECPLCQAGRKAQFKSYMLVIDRADNKVKLFKASKRVMKSIFGLIEEYGDITSRDYKIFRQGEKLETTYQFFPKDATPQNIDGLEIPELNDMIQVYSRDDIINLMSNGIGGDSNSTPAAPPANNPPAGGYPF